MANITHDDRTYLSDYVYGNKPGSRDSEGKLQAPTGYKILDKREKTDSGLEIYAIRKLGTDDVVFVTRGTDSEPNTSTDWLGPNPGLVFGYMTDQMEEAVKFANDFKESRIDQETNQDLFTYSTAGHSKGGGFSQILSDAFGWEGTTTDAVPASGVVNSTGYREYLESLEIERQGVPEGKFVNIFESGSLVSDGVDIIRNFVGEVLEINMIHKFGIVNQHDSINFVDIMTQIREQSGDDESIYALFEIQNGLLTTEQKEVLKRLKELDPTDIETYDEYETLELTANQLKAGLERLQSSQYNTLKANNLLDKEISANHFRITLPEGNLVVALKDSDGIWSVKEFSKSEVRNDDPTDPFDPSGDGVGIYDGNYDNFNTADMDSVLDYIVRDDWNIVYDPETGERIVQDSSDHPPGADFEEVADYLDGIQYAFADGQIVIIYPDGKIVTPPAIASNDGAGTSSPINKDNLPANKAELSLQLQDAGFSKEEADNIANSADTDLLAANQTEEGIVNGDLLYDIARDLLDDTLDSLAIDPDLASFDPDRFIEEQEQALRDTAEAARHAAELRQADLAVMSAGMTLRNAIANDDDSEIAEAMLDYLVASSNKAALYPNSSGLPDSYESAFQMAATGFGLHNAIEDDDSWAIATETIQLLEDINKFMEVNHDTFGTHVQGIIPNEWANEINLSQAILSLAQAIDGGDDWDIASSAANLVKEIDQYSDIINLGDDFLNGITSAISLAANIANFDDILDSGDELQIAYTTASMVNDGIKLYNTYASATGIGQVGNGYGSYLGYVGAAVQALQGDYIGGWVTVASTILCYFPPWGTVAAVALQILNAAGFFGDSGDVPEALAWFELDANGNVIMGVTGDSDLQEYAEKYGNYLKKIIQNFKDQGGRVEIDGTLPSLNVRGGGLDPQILYKSDMGGSVAINITDNKKLLSEMRGALYARDRGDRVDTAIKMSTMHGGKIDLAKVDRILAGQGFVKKTVPVSYGKVQDPGTKQYSRPKLLNKGIPTISTWTYGESWAPKIGQSFGSGIFMGGGNVGGREGKHYAASDIKSLTVRPELLPSQTMGRITKAISMNHNFAGAGAMLLAMGLGIDNGFAAIDPAFFGTVQQETDNTDTIKPLAGDELDLYNQQINNLDSVNNQGPSLNNINTASTLTGPEAIREFAALHWNSFGGADNTSDEDIYSHLLPDSAFHYRDGSELYTSYTHNARTPVWVDDEWLPPGRLKDFSLTAEETTGQDSGNNDDNGNSSGGGSSDSTPVVRMESDFTTSEDASLRITESSLLRLDHERYSSPDDTYEFVSLDSARNGTVYRDANGDIRFQANADFSGETSFSYSLRDTDGTIISQTATVFVGEVNDPPELMDDTFILDEGQSFNLARLLDNDTDIDGDILKIDHLRGLEHAEVSLVNSQLIMTPEEGFNGDINFTYWVKDRADSYPMMAAATITYLEQNQPPIATDDRYLILEDHELNVTIDELLANDKEYDGEQIEFVGIGSSDHGQVRDNGDGTITFTPDVDYAGTEAGFTYQIKDESDNMAEGQVNIDVLDQREPPVVTADTRPTINEGDTISFTPEEVATFVYDGDGDQLHLDFIQNIVGGTVITENGYLKFIGDADFSGRASFDYQANDNHRGIVQGHMEFDVLPVNDPIDTGIDEFTIDEETVLTTSVNEITANDNDPEASAISFVALGTALHGTTTLAADETITFTPDTDYSGADAGFNYTVADDQGLQSTGFVKVTVNNVNDAPESSTDTVTINEDQPLVFDTGTIERFISDKDGDTVTLTAIDTVTGGTVAENSGVFTFTPDSNYHGPASLNYTGTDNNGGIVTGALALDILSVNDPTSFDTDELTTTEETQVTTTIADLMANDTDVDGNLQFVSTDGAVHGSVILNGDEITFTPDADYSGNDAGFSYTVRDTENNEATGFVTVKVDNINDMPEIIGNTLTINEDEQVVFDAATIDGLVHDKDGDTITITSMSGVTNGSVIDAAGVYTFTPDQDFYGTATLTYSADDGAGGVVTSDLSFTINSVNDGTDFGDDTLNTLEEQSVQTTVDRLMSNDSDADGNGTLDFISLGQSRHGDVVLDADGTVTFTPNVDYFGTEAGFEYLVKDGDGNESTGFVTVNVDNINDAPEITHNHLYIDEDTPIIFTASEVDRFIHDADNETPILENVTNVTGGSISISNGLYTFTPETNYYGRASFDYTAKDASGVQVAGHMAIGIAAVNDIPTVAATAATMDEDGEITFSVASLMGGATDVEDGSDLRFDGIDSSVNGDAWVDDNGLVHFSPYADFFGNSSFGYRVVDSEGGVGIGVAAIDVIGENDAPVAVDDERIIAWSNNSYENIYGAGTLLANDYDVDFDPLTITSLGDAGHGSVSLDGLGNIHYIAKSDDWVGIDHFTYTISDGHGGESEATATIDVKINTSPDAYSELLLSSEDIVGNIDQATLLANDSDVDGDTLFITAVNNAEHGSVELLANGTIRFTPELNYNNLYPGRASFEYTVSDGISDPVSTVAFVDLEPVNDAPILVPELVSGAVEDNSFEFTVDQIIANDYDVEMESPYEVDSFTFTGVRGADHGSISWDEATDTIYYVPDRDFCRTETFYYELTDSYGAKTVAKSHIWVEPVNDNPIAQVDYGSTAETLIWNKYSVSGLLGNDFDVDGDSLYITNPHVTRGSASVSLSGGYLQVKPSQGERYVEVSYTVSDGNGGTAPSKLILPSIIEHNFAPVFTGVYVSSWNYFDIYADFWDVNFRAHVSDENPGDHLTVSPSQVSNGRVTKYSDSSFNYYGSLSPGNFTHTTFTLTVSDQRGGSGTVFIGMWGTAQLIDDGVGPTFGYRVYGPVVLDLDGDGIELLGRDAGVGFDWTGNGELNQTGWVAADDGLLAYDHNHDGLIARADEISFTGYLPGATTDLEGLQAFDSNQDGVFDARDDNWEDFGVWQDQNSDGVSDEGEFKSLDAMGITSIGLTSDHNSREVNGNTIYGSTTYETDDGTTHEAGDVALQGEDIDVTHADPADEQLEETIDDEQEQEDSQSSDTAADTEESDADDADDTDDVDDVDDVDDEESSDSDTTSTDDEDDKPDTDTGNDIDEAEVNRVADQLQSDIASHNDETSAEETDITSQVADDADGPSEEDDVGAEDLPLAA